jgi:type IV secretory pathway TraG/TraD family ATPase VirD4
MLLDEFPQLGRLDAAITMLETCRSKGVCTVLAAQSLEQLDVRYGAEQRKVMEAMLRHKIILRVSTGATASYISKELIGYREVNAPPRPAPGPTPGTEREKDSDKVEPQQLLLPSQLANFRSSSYGPEGVVIGPGPDVYKLAWPFDKWPDQRPAHVARRKSKMPDPKRQT